MSDLTADEAELWHLWKSAADAVRTRIGDELAAATGLSDPDFGVLSRLIDLGAGTLRQNELAASMGWHRSRLSHQLTRMEERGHVTRTAVPGGVQVAATSAGAAAIAAARPVHAAAVRAHLAALVPPAQRAEFAATLRRLGEAATAD
jgi:DNA-binding MarR family transcriptional regulator